MTKKFSIGTLQQFSDPYWGRADYPADAPDWTTGQSFIDQARQLEEAKFDYVFFLDVQAVVRDTQGSMEAALKVASTAPDPMYLLPLLAQATRHIGLIATASTTFYSPFMLARAFSTLDSIARGRVGWNIVTSYEEHEAKNYGLTETLPHAERYERADEFVEVARKLWESWEPDAVIRDLETMTYTDASRVHSVDHVGKYFRSQGPLVTSPSPQRVPFLAQAGASPRGRDFAAKHAELTFVNSAGVSTDDLKAARDDIRARAVSAGRNPDDINVTFSFLQQFLPDDFDQSLPVPISQQAYEFALLAMCQTLNLDLTAFPADEPFPVDTPPSGVTSMFENMIGASKRGLTLREAVTEQFVGVDPKMPARDAPGFHGTPEQVADKALEFMDAVGGDGIMLTGDIGSGDAFTERVTERFMPRLRAGGAIREDYVDGMTLRESMKSLRS
ncbi:MAG TPA: NtaA/DmoA family FMN-dependent monooxygenase [Pseudolysinimonas sp.]|nr:NtaA/DmoA family FMN-dependent monooxygenase [Pseudolysinimonas sp.]